MKLPAPGAPMHLKEKYVHLWRKRARAHHRLLAGQCGRRVDRRNPKRTSALPLASYAGLRQAAQEHLARVVSLHEGIEGFRSHVITMDDLHARRVRIILIIIIAALAAVLAGSYLW